MDNVVYVLGAGFSAPLGMPVTANFMEAAQDMYIADPETYVHFKKIFDFARGFGAIKNYVASDQLNIEEILSILEMQGDAKERPEQDLFIRFLRDVILYHMPKWAVPSQSELAASNWQDLIWGKGDLASLYGRFVGSVLGLLLRGRQPGEAAPEYGHGQARYCVVSFNYDGVLERACANASESMGQEGCVAFRSVQQYRGDGVFGEQPVLVKLHGDAERGHIVPPTWSKGASESVMPAWACAYRALREAQRIRFLGYSLPAGDDYFKYLIKAAFTSGIYRKEIDAVCLDSDGTVAERYQAFFPTRKLRFTSMDVTKYLAHVAGGTTRAGTVGREFAYESLEASHSTIMKQALLS